MRRRLKDLARVGRSAPSRTDSDPPESTSDLSPPLLDGIKVWHNCSDATIDICFVHGLTGNRDSTWTASKQSMPWPTLLLPPKLPSARLLTWGYDAYIVQASVASKNRLTDHATNLLIDLTNDRASCDASSRPLIFIAHSLGGLVCKEAILLSRNNPESHLCNVFEYTAGIIFMGTPHRGSWMADWMKIPASGLGVLKSTNKSLLQILETDNQLLESIRLRFWAMVREQRESGRQLGITCFFEELPLPIVGQVVSKMSATLEGYTSVSVHANHREMVKFRTENDNGFVRLAGDLMRWQGETRSMTSHFMPASRQAPAAGIDGAYSNLNDVLSTLPIAVDAPFNAYNRQHEPACLPNTRVDLLQEIYDWADGKDGQDEERCIFWLNGLAGTGKSTISRTVARKYSEQKRLGASFFFSKGGRDVSHAGKFFTSLAVQLANTIPSLQKHICDAIVERRDIANLSLLDQWRQLVLGPLSSLEKSHQSYVLVVDALDECEGDNNVRIILELLAEARSLKTVRLRVFLTSRPEIPIRYSMHYIIQAEHQDFVLHSVPPTIVNHDISLFLEYNLGIIRQEWTLGADWPGEVVLRQLVLYACGLFIWAATACRFIREGKRFARKRLDIILKGSSSAITAPEKHLNEIYLAVLKHSISSEYSDEEKEEVCDMLKYTLGSIVVLLSPLSTSSLSRLLHLPREDVDWTFKDLYAILDIPEDPTRQLRLHHPSFRDFLFDKDRCSDPRFWVDKKQAHRTLADSCIRLLSASLKQNICNLPNPGILRRNVNDQTIADSLPKEVQYACHYWVDHLEHGDSRIRDRGDVHTFLQRFFLYWLEAMSLCGLASESIHMIHKLQSILEPSESIETSSFLSDAVRFIFSYGSIGDSSPLQLYSSALIFAPKASTTFQNCILGWISQQPTVGHSSSVTSVASSHDSKLLDILYDYYVKRWRNQYEHVEDTQNSENETESKWETRSEYQVPVDEASLEWEGSDGNDVEEIVRVDPALSVPPLFRSRSQYPDLAMIAPSPVASPLLEFSTPVFMEFTEKRNRRALVDHFCNVLSHLVVFKEDTRNPFRQLLLPLSYASSPVMNAIFALSCAHLECRGIENEEKSLDFHNRALQGLAQLIEQNERAHIEEVLGAIMLLVYYEVLVQRGCSNIVNGHLKGAMTIMKSGPLISTPTHVFLERAFRFYDVIAALSLGTSPNTTTQPTATPFPFPPASDFPTANSPLRAVDTLLGLSIDLWPIIHRLSHLLSFKVSLEAAIAAGQTSKATVLRTELENTSQAIEMALREWKPILTPPPENEDDKSDIFVEGTRIKSILNNAEAYRHSAFVYLYRTIRSLPRSHLSVQKHAHLSLLACSNVVQLAEQCQNGPMTALLWPLFVAACEATVDEDRALALYSFGGMERRQGMNNIMRAWEVVQEVWRKADLKEDEEVNWGYICQEKGFSIVFG